MLGAHSRNRSLRGIWPYSYLSSGALDKERPAPLAAYDKTGPSDAIRDRGSTCFGRLRGDRHHVANFSAIGRIFCFRNLENSSMLAAGGLIAP